MPPIERPKLAVILTEYGHHSHGVCFCTKFLEGKQYDDHYEPPRCEVVSMHLMEIAKNDVGVETAAKHQVPMYHSVAAALCRGGDELAVDGVVLIGEHGTYPFNERGQHLYPRRELFDQIVSVFRQAGRSVPVFNDKHFSWNWEWAKWMWKQVGELNIPFMAGSSLPYAKYEPFVKLPRGREIDHVIAFGYGGLESYGFHALETGQFVVEARAGGETGLAAVQCLSGEEVWRAHEAGRWPQEIAEAAFAAAWEAKGKPWDYTKGVYAYDLEYRDGQRMTVFMLNGYCEEFGFAYRVRGATDITATSYKLDPPLRLKHFSSTVRSLEEMYLTGKATEPAERTLLTTGTLAYLVDSHHQGGIRLETPDLDISYAAPQRPEAWTEVLR